MEVPEYALELLLAYDGRLHFYASGEYLRFQVKAVQKSRPVPHGIAHSLTLHAPDGRRLLGFDNAHRVPHRGARHVRRKPEADHWHRAPGDKGRPYEFVSVERLLEDFFAEAGRVLAQRGVAFEIVDEKEGRK
ncbi:MAG: hypothetical protein HYX46_03385 [Betaproteobacteria bacterium]|nr:hypothetical protein [Betaproteobacteria bacterium]